jgi:hypothetical protein
MAGKFSRRVGSGVAVVAMLAGLAAPAAGQLDPSIQPSLEEAVVWPEPTNAAPIYWRAFEFYQHHPDLKGVDWSEMLAVDDASGYGLSEEQLALLGHAEEAIGMALRASRVEACNWEIDYDQGIGALLPHLGKLRNLSRLFAADVRRCVMEDDLDGAVDRLAALHAFARSVRGDGVLISSLVSCAIANMASQQTTEMLARVDLTREQQERLLAALDAYGEEDPFAVRQAMSNEGVWMTAWVAEGIREGRVREQLDYMFSISEEGPAAQIEALKRMSDEAMIDDLRRCRQYYADAVAIWGERDAADRLEAMGELVEGGTYGEFAKVLAAALSKAHQADERGQRTLRESREQVLADEVAQED